MEYLYPVAAAVAAWIFGAAWYGVLGKQYQRALGKDPGASARAGATKDEPARAGTTKDEVCRDQKMPVAPLVACFVGELVMAAALSWLLARMSVVGWMWGAMAGAIIGIGVILPTVVINHMFPGRSKALMLIDGLHWVAVAVIEGAVLGAFAAIAP